jgi:hypothetical protein
VHEITIREDGPGENTKITGADHLPLVEQIAVHIAGYIAEEVFKRPLPRYASGADHLQVAALLIDLPKTQADALREGGHDVARKLLKQHKRKVCKVAARLMEHRRMDGFGFKRLMEAND